MAKSIRTLSLSLSLSVIFCHLTFSCHPVHPKAAALRKEPVLLLWASTEPNILGLVKRAFGQRGWPSVSWADLTEPWL